MIILLVTSDPFIVTLSYLGGDTVQIDNFYGTQISLNYIISRDKNENLTVVNTLTDEITNAYFDDIAEIKGYGSYSSCNKTITVDFFIIDAAVGDTIITGTDNFIHK